MALGLLIIQMSGPKLGRPSTEPLSRQERKIEYSDNTDRIEVERSFSLSYHKLWVYTLVKCDFPNTVQIP